MIENVQNRVADIESRFNPSATAPPPASEADFMVLLNALAAHSATRGPALGVGQTLDAILGNDAAYGTVGAYPTLAGDADQRRATLEPHFQAAGQRYGIDPQLLSAVAWTESNYRSDAVSHAGAQGLMQIMPGTAASLGVDPSDPIAAIDGAARYLRTQLDTFGSLDLALAAYNAGPGAVSSHGGIPPFPETTAYVGKVLGRYTQLGGEAR